MKDLSKFSIFSIFAVILSAIFFLFVDAKFTPIHNVITGVIITVIVFLISFRAYKIYNVTNDKRMMIVAVSFFSATIFEILHSIYSWQLTLMGYYWYCEAFAYIAGILIPVLFSGNYIALNPKQFKKKTLGISFGIVLFAVLIEKLVGESNLRYLIERIPLADITLALFLTSALIYIDIRKSLNLYAISTLVTGLWLIAIANFYVPSIVITESKIRFALGVVFILGRINILLGIEEFALKTKFLSVKTKLLLSTVLFFVFIYLLSIVYSVFILDITISQNYEYFFLITTILIVLFQYLILNKATESINRTVRLIENFKPAIKPEKIPVISNDEIGILAQELNKSFELNWKYEENIEKNIQREKLKTSILRTIREKIDIVELKQNIDESIVKILNANRCFIIDYDKNEEKFLKIDNEYRCTDNLKSVISLDPEKDIKEFLVNLKKGRIFVSENLSEYIEKNKLQGSDIDKYISKYQVKSGFAVPFYYRDSLLGVLVIHYTQFEKTFSADNIQFIKDISDQVALAIYQSKLYEQAKENANRESLLRKIDSAIRSTLDINLLKKIVVNEIGKALNADRCLISHIDVNTGKFVPIDENAEYLSSLEIKSHIGVDMETEELRPFKKLLQYDKKEFIVPDADNPPDYYDDYLLETLKKYDVKSTYTLPIAYGEQCLGVLYINYVKQAKIISKEQLEFFRALANQTGIAIHQSNLYYIMKNTAQREYLLREIIETIRGSIDIEDVLNKIIDKIAAVFDVERITLTEFPEKNNYRNHILRREYRANKNIKTVYESPVSVDVLELWAKRVMKDGLILGIDNIPESDMPEKFKEMYEFLGVKSIIAVPIKSKDEEWGILVLSEIGEYRYWTEDETSLLHSISHQIYSAIKQAELYETIKHKAERESLLRKIIETIRGALDIKEVKRIIVDEVGKTLNADRCYFRTFDKKAHEFLPVNIDIEYLSSPEIEHISSVPISKKVHEFFHKQAEGAKPFVPLIFNQEFFEKEKHVTPDLIKYFEQAGIKTNIVIPIWDSGSELTFLVFHYVKNISSFSEEDAKLIETISEQVIIAIEQSVLYETIKQKAELEETRKTFLATLIHDLRSPLNAVQKALEFIVSRKESTPLGSFLEYLKDIYNTNKDLLAIINDILTIHHLESGKLSLNIELCNVSEIIDESIKTIKYLAVENESDIEINVDRNLPYIEVDKGKIKRVITNIITNSIKHNEKGTKITVSAKKINGSIKISISDNGKGIPEEAIEKIFQKFPTEKRKIGTGLGLYLSKEIVEAHNGIIGFDTEVNKGTTFYFTLPILVNK